jgi:hypothetical protein
MYVKVPKYYVTILEKFLVEMEFEIYSLKLSVGR